jgi:NADH-quinone oxidoreductase subunit J
VGALLGGGLMLVLRDPMRVAMALIATMLCLGAIYGLIGVHFIAAFQVLIYVGAVMVFMVYAIMLLERRGEAVARHSKWLVPGLVGLMLLVGVLGVSVWRAAPAPAHSAADGVFGIAQFSRAFLDEYWLHFEVTSILLLAAVVAAIAVIRVGRRSERG